MKRWTIRILLLLILGVGTTVGVAWGCAWRAEWGASTVVSAQIGPETWTNRLTATGLGVTVSGSWEASVEVSQEHGLSFHGDETGGRSTYVASGWPMRSLSCVYPEFVVLYREYGAIALSGQVADPSDGVLLPERGAMKPRALPLRPILPGFIINTLFYAAMWFGVFFGVAALRRTIRRKRGRCVKCGYDLRGNVANGQDARSTNQDARSTNQDARSTNQDARSTSQDARSTSQDARSAGCPECGFGREVCTPTSAAEGI